MADFQTRDPRSPAFWDERFARGFTPWDLGRAPAALGAFVARAERPLATLIPGCGSGYELALLGEAGWDATAIDFSPAAVAAAKAALGRWGERVLLADFFSYAPPRQLELIYERAFLCAMPREMWEAVARRWADLLAPGGLLAGYFFFDEAPKGPPFGITRARLGQLLDADFVLVEDAPVDDSAAVFESKERWMVWRRRQDLAR